MYLFITKIGRNFSEEETDRLDELCTNGGIEITVKDSEFPLPWDASIIGISKGNITLCGYAGAYGFGIATVKIPVDRTLSCLNMTLAPRNWNEDWPEVCKILHDAGWEAEAK